MVLAAGAGFEPQLGQPETSGGKRLDDVHRLQLFERDLLRLLEDRAGLDPEFLVIDHKAVKYQVKKPTTAATSTSTPMPVRIHPRSSRSNWFSSPSGTRSRAQ